MRRILFSILLLMSSSGSLAKKPDAPCVLDLARMPVSWRAPADAELDTDKLKATLNSSRAKLAAARARVLDAEATLVEKRLVYERKKILVAKRISSQQDADTAKAPALPGGLLRRRNIAERGVGHG